MTKQRLLVLEAIALAMVILVAIVVFLQAGDSGPGVAVAPSGSILRIPSSRPSTAPASASTRPTATPSLVAATPVTTPTPTEEPTATPEPTPPPTPAARTSAKPDRAYAEFLQRLNDDRAKVDELNQALTSAVTALDRERTRAGALAVLDFVDEERQWLLDHPPANCYADAHAAGVAMLDAYQTAASLFVDWAGTTGLAGLAALGKAADAANVATDAFTRFSQELVSTRCPG